MRGDVLRVTYIGTRGWSQLRPASTINMGLISRRLWPWGSSVVMPHFWKRS